MDEEYSSCIIELMHIKDDEQNPRTENKKLSTNTE